MNQYIVEILPLGIKKKAGEGKNLRKVIIENGIRLSSPCGGKGRCGKCLVTLSDNTKQEVTSEEKKHLDSEDISKGIRLACQTLVREDIKVEIPGESIVSDVNSGDLSLDKRIKPLPFVNKYFLQTAEATLAGPDSDLDRLTKSLLDQDIKPKDIDLNILSDLPGIMRSNSGKLTATVWNKKRLLDIEPGKVKGSYGLAIDLGTTKIGMVAVDLDTGKIIGSSGAANPQMSFGEDVISRIQYISSNRNGKTLLQYKAVNTINLLIDEICSRHRIDFRHIYEATVVCNSVMHHMLLGISPEYLSESPYVPAIKGSLNIPAESINIRINPRANIHFPPLISGFSGSDCLADIIATGIHKEKDICLLLDIGTNTEIVLGNKERMLACSCASGPAFEGGHITCGMKAIPGAIENVKIDPISGQIFVQTIGDTQPKGLCGSGIIDCMAEMLKAGIIDRKGILGINSGFNKIRKNKKGYSELVVVSGKGRARDIVINQGDVSEIQLAKAAIHSGISILMKEAGITPDRIGRVYITGAFGSSINPDNVLTLGMIPDIPLKRIVNSANSAVTGAYMALISKRARNLSRKISKRIEYIELAAYPEFESFYIPALAFTV